MTEKTQSFKPVLMSVFSNAAKIWQKSPIQKQLVEGDMESS